MPAPGRPPPRQGPAHVPGPGRRLSELRVVVLRILPGHTPALRPRPSPLPWRGPSVISAPARPYHPLRRAPPGPSDKSDATLDLLLRPDRPFLQLVPMRSCGGLCSGPGHFLPPPQIHAPHTPLNTLQTWGPWRLPRLLLPPSLRMAMCSPGQGHPIVSFVTSDLSRVAVSLVCFFMNIFIHYIWICRFLPLSFFANGLGLLLIYTPPQTHTHTAFITP